MCFAWLKSQTFLKHLKGPFFLSGHQNYSYLCLWMFSVQKFYLRFSNSSSSLFVSFSLVALFLTFCCQWTWIAKMHQRQRNVASKTDSFSEGSNQKAAEVTVAVQCDFSPHYQWFLSEMWNAILCCVHLCGVSRRSARSWWCCGSSSSWQEI